MLPFVGYENMKSREIQEGEINKITKNSKPREQAFFTLMRQSGLLPHTIRQLKIGNLEKILEPQTPVPCSINISDKGLLTFIGQEAIYYIKQYLRIRMRKEKLTPESLLFTAKNNPNKAINVKDVSRTFRQSVQKLGIAKIVGQKIKRGERNEICLFSLRRFYENKTRDYQKALEDNPPKDLESSEICTKNIPCPFWKSRPR